MHFFKKIISWASRKVGAKCYECYLDPRKFFRHENAQNNSYKPDADDLLATQLGNEYRGLGILVGFLGFLVFLCALIPVAAIEYLSEGCFESFHILELISLALIFFAVYVPNIKYIHRDWMEARWRGEINRYQTLKSFIDSHNQEQLLQELVFVLNDQIAYNKKKLEEYESVERWTLKILSIAFIITVVGTVANMRWHNPLWLFAILLPPIFPGIIHGINGFLGMPTLIVDHKRVLKKLRNFKNQLQSLIDLKSKEPIVFEDSLMAFGGKVYGFLVGSIGEWVHNIAEAQRINPP